MVSFMPNFSSFFAAYYEGIDTILILLQRLFLSVQILCGFEIRAPHGIEDESSWFVRHVVRVSRNYYLILKDFRNGLAQKYSSDRIAKPELMKTLKPIDTKHSSPASTSEPPPECDESAIKRCSIEDYTASVEVARYESMNFSSVAKKMVVGLFGVIPEHHSFTVLAGLLPLKGDDEAFYSADNSPISKTSDANVTMYDDLNDDSSSVKEIDGDGKERPMIASCVKQAKGRRKADLKPRFVDNVEIYHQKHEGDLKSLNTRTGTPHPKRGSKKSKRVLDQISNRLSCTVEEDEVQSPRSNDLSSFFEDPEELPRSSTL